MDRILVIKPANWLFGSRRTRNRGDRARDGGQWSAAATAYRRYLRSKPHDKGIWVQLGHVLKEQGQLGEAVEAYRGALALDEHYADALLHLGRALKGEGDIAGAAVAFANSFELDGNRDAGRELEDPDILAKVPKGRNRTFIRTAAGSDPSEVVAIDQVEASGLFLASWYLGCNKDVAAAGIDPLHHFVRFGWKELRDPSPDFSVSWYLSAYPDVAMAGVNPLLHYIRSGWREGRNPHRDFNTNKYLEVHSHVLNYSINPLTHLYHQYIIEGSRRTKLSNFSDPSHDFNDIDLRSAYSPTISILLPVYKTDLIFLREVIRSVRSQSYPYWELCIIDDGSNDEVLTEALSDAVAADSRIKVNVREQNGGIAKASQDALQMASGDYVCFVDHDDLLTSDAIGAMVLELRKDPTIDYLYSDHAMIDEGGAITGLALKPDWSPEFFLSTNYIVHFKVMRREAVNAIGGFAAEASIVQDIGMTCRMIEGGAKIRHVPQVLYCWRAHAKSVASGTQAKKAIEHLALQTYNEHLRRRGITATLSWPTTFRDRSIGAYKLNFEPSPRAAAIIILDCRDIEDSARWLEELVHSGKPRTFVMVNSRSRSRVRISGQKNAWSAAELCALVAELDVEDLVFVQGSAKPLTREWDEELLGYLGIDPAIGAVGGKVLDYSLAVRGGAFRYLERVEVLGGGGSDNVDGYWFTNRIASNVMAVSCALMATRKSDFLTVGGFNPSLDRNLAGLEYCSKVRKLNKRVVYNPWAKIVDDNASDLAGYSENPDLEIDAYYHRSFSKREIYTYD